jgi:hypothetical protein
VDRISGRLGSRHVVQVAAGGGACGTSTDTAPCDQPSRLGKWTVGELCGGRRPSRDPDPDPRPTPTRDRRPRPRPATGDPRPTPTPTRDRPRPATDPDRRPPTGDRRQSDLKATQACGRGLGPRIDLRSGGTVAGIFAPADEDSQDSLSGRLSRQRCRVIHQRRCPRCRRRTAHRLTTGLRRQAGPKPKFPLTGTSV